MEVSNGEIVEDLKTLRIAFCSFSLHCFSNKPSLSDLFVLNKSSSARMTKTAAILTSSANTKAIAKSNCEDNPVQRIMAIDAIVDVQEMR